MPRRTYGHRHATVCTLVLFLMSLAVPNIAQAKGPTPLIFDTDMGNDIDDALAWG